jgi:hypothetical protein
MKDIDKLIRVYSGNEVLVSLLKDKLEENEISSAIQNDSANSFLRGVPAAVDLYIKQSDIGKAKTIINEFINNNA